MMMTDKGLRTIRLEGPTILRLESGVEFRVEPAGNGITILPHGRLVAVKPSHKSADKRGGGRRPSQETQALRDELRRDAENGGVKDAGHYVAWLRALRPAASDSSLQQIVYRERRLILEEFPGAAKPGRKARRGAHVAVTLRTKLEKDVAEGELRDAGHYVKWLVDAADVGLKQARPVVYRELKRIDA